MAHEHEYEHEEGMHQEEHIHIERPAIIASCRRILPTSERMSAALRRRVRSTFTST